MPSILPKQGTREPDYYRYKMNNKQRAFVEEYLIDFNATQAALRAGYSERTARSMGCENLTKPDIAAEIERRLDEKTMKADEVLTRLSDMARGDMGDFLDIESMSFDLSLRKAKELGLTHLIKKVKQRTVTTLKKDGDDEETHYVEIELHDAQSALEKLGKAHKLFVDRKEVTGKDGGPLSISMVEVIKDYGE